MAAKKKAKKKQAKKKAKPDIKPDIKLDTKIGSPLGISAGRPKGAKNKTTLFKEVMKNGFEEEMQKEFFAVMRAVIHKAKGPPSRDKDGELLRGEDGEVLYLDGDSSAQKMLFDRAVPVTKAVDINASDIGKTGGVTIHIEKLVADTGRIGETIEDGEVIEND